MNFFNERMSESTAEVCQTQQAEDPKHQKEKKKKEKKEKKGLGSDGWMKRTEKRERVEEEKKKRSEEDLVGTWPDWAMVTGPDQALTSPAIQCFCNSPAHAANCWYLTLIAGLLVCH